MTTPYPPPADSPTWTFQDAVTAIVCAAGIALPMPAWIRDNTPGTNLLALNWTSIEQIRPWYQYFGARQHRADPPVWAWGWHGWTVCLDILAQQDSRSGDAIETPSPDLVATQPEPPVCVIGADPPRYNQAACDGPARWSVAYMTSNRDLIVRKEPVCHRHAANEVAWQNRRRAGRVEMWPLPREVAAAVLAPDADILDEVDPAVAS